MDKLPIPQWCCSIASLVHLLQLEIGMRLSQLQTVCRGVQVLQFRREACRLHQNVKSIYIVIKEQHEHGPVICDFFRMTFPYCLRQPPTR